MISKILILALFSLHLGHVNASIRRHDDHHHCQCSDFTFLNFNNECVGIAICLCPNCYFIDFSTSLLFPSGKTLGLRFFSLNSRVILKSSRPKAENFSILPKNLMKKIEIQVFSLTETTRTRKIV